jgi:hypothetical protein
MDQREPKQKTQPKKGKPIEIPVPKRRDVENVFKKASRGTERKK